MSAVTGWQSARIKLFYRTRQILNRICNIEKRRYFRRFLNTIRVEKACTLLQDSPMSIKEICYECGFESTRTFHRVFLEEQKMTPGDYRERMRTGWATIPDDDEEEEKTEPAQEPEEA